MAVSLDLGGTFVSVLIIRALPFGVHFTARDVGNSQILQKKSIHRDSGLYLCVLLGWRSILGLGLLCRIRSSYELLSTCLGSPKGVDSMSTTPSRIGTRAFAVQSDFYVQGATLRAVFAVIQRASTTSRTKSVRTLPPLTWG